MLEQSFCSLCGNIEIPFKHLEFFLSKLPTFQGSSALFGGILFCPHYKIQDCNISISITNLYFRPSASS